jgi:exocyst complex component 1
MSIPSSKSKSKSKAIFPDHSTAYSYFYRYAGFILFAKEVDLESYTDIRQLYLSPASRSYKEDFRTFVSQWKSSARKAISDDLELIFSNVKEPQSTVSAVRSASIKRAGTVAKTLASRSPITDGLSRAERDRERSEQEGKLPVGEVFSEILSVVIPAFVKEQSFIMVFLHLSPSGKSFEEFVRPGVDKTSWMRDLDKKRSPELDKNAAKEVMAAMEQLLSWLPDELSSIVEWCRTLDALYGLLMVSLTLGNWSVSWVSWKSISANGKIQIRRSL